MEDDQRNWASLFLRRDSSDHTRCLFASPIFFRVLADRCRPRVELHLFNLRAFLADSLILRRVLSECFLPFILKFRSATRETLYPLRTASNASSATCSCQRRSFSGQNINTSNSKASAPYLSQAR